MTEEDEDFDEEYAAKIRWGSIDWVMTWGPQYPDRPPTENQFEDSKALAVLLAREVVFINSFHWEKTWPKEAREKTSLAVICNDVFVWGSADAEELNYSEIEDLWKHFKQDPIDGPAVWCMKKRGQMPQAPVLKGIIKRNIWDVEKLKVDLKVNFYDTVSKMDSEARYAVYSAWCLEKGSQPLPYDKKWWEGWKEYAAAHPQYQKMEWYIAATKQISDFREEYNKPKSENLK